MGGNHSPANGDHEARRIQILGERHDLAIADSESPDVFIAIRQIRRLHAGGTLVLRDHIEWIAGTRIDPDVMQVLWIHQISDAVQEPERVLFAFVAYLEPLRRERDHEEEVVRHELPHHVNVPRIVNGFDETPDERHIRHSHVLMLCNHTATLGRAPACRQRPFETPSESPPRAGNQ
jgi:hypothetical protein